MKRDCNTCKNLDRYDDACKYVLQCKERNMYKPMDKPDIVYICKGKGMPCYLHPYCVHREDPIAGTDHICSHTLQPECAKYGECKDPENHSERFVFYKRPNDCGPSYYWEIEPNEHDLYSDSD